MQEKPAQLFEDDFDKLFPKKEKRVVLPEGNYEFCPECNGEAEVRRAWAVNHWQMKPCEYCDGNGYIQERSIAEILENFVSESTAERITEALITAGFFFLKKRDIFYIEKNVRANVESEYEEKLSKLTAERPSLEDEDGMITIPVQYQLSSELREAADRRASTLPNSPQALALYKAADLLVGIYEEEGEINE